MTSTYRSGFLAWLLLSVLAGHAHAGLAGLQLGTSEGRPGEQVGLDLSISGAVEAVQFDLSYDIQSVELVAVMFPADFRLDFASIGAGQVRIVGWREDCPETGQRGSAQGQLTFAVREQAVPGDTSIVLSQPVLVSTQAEAMEPVDLSDGLISILGDDGPIPEPVSEPIPVPGPGGLALLLLVVLLTIMAALAVRKRPDLLLVVMVVGAAGLASTDAGSDARIQGDSVEAPDFSAKVDIILERQAFDPALDCNGDGVIDARDLVCARNDFCSEVPNQPPVMQPVADQTLEAGATLSLQVEATDPDPGDVLAYSLATAPDGMGHRLGQRPDHLDHHRA